MLRFLSRMPLRSGAWRALMVLVAAVAAFTLPARKAAAQINDQHMPFTTSFFNPCTGEVLTRSGFFLFRESITSTPNFHFCLEEKIENFQGTTALGGRDVGPRPLS